MKGLLAATAGFVLLGLRIAAQAAITIDTVGVSDAGNAPDTRYTTSGHGAVDYNYNVGKYEVTAAQYTAFLNAVAKSDTYSLYHTNTWGVSYACGIQRSGSPGSYSYGVAADLANRPVNWVSYWDCCRFANWLGNGQRTGFQDASTTERGAYTLDGYNGTDGRTIQRNAGWKWAVTSEDEWYKAAYYKGGGTDAGYWDYPTSSDTRPGRDMGDASGNNANWNDAGMNLLPIDSGKYTTVAGEFQNSHSPYGAFDQGGNLWEWNEALVTDTFRGYRGGSFYDGGYSLQASSSGGINDPTKATPLVGFRVSSIPEPSSATALAGALLSFLGLRRRKA